MERRPHTRSLTIVAQDPSLVDGRRIVTAQVEIPAEVLAPGPMGYRVHVVDFDASTDTLYRPLERGLDGDPFANPSNATILGDPCFHAQNVYAIVMRTLARFEHALGRRARWGFPTHQLKVAPHAFASANAFYSDRDEALMFGYFEGRRGPVFTSLSHDVVAHETTHALLDGLRERFTSPSSPDQAAFHEAFADIVALLSVFALREVVRFVLAPRDRKLISRHAVTANALRKSALLGLAKQMGEELQASRGGALRRSAELKPDDTYLLQPEYQPAHRRGEVLVAAVLNTFVELWTRSLKTLGTVRKGMLDVDRVVADGAEIADVLLTSCIRAIDYTPPTDVSFSDFSAALLTADRELHPSDARFGLRETLRASFRAYGIASPETADAEGCWKAPTRKLTYDATHFEPMQRDPVEVFRFIWENRRALDIEPSALTQVQSVRPCIRIGYDGFTLRETVVEYVQTLKMQADELAALRVKKPELMPADQELTLYGGGTLIFDEYGRLKFHIYNHISSRRQSQRLEHLWNAGFFSERGGSGRAFAQLHLDRAGASLPAAQEVW